MVADVTFWGVVWYIIAGIVIGLIARAILPGKQSMSLLWTMILGIAAALIGGFLWNAIFPNNDGIAWIGSIIVAVIILFLYERFAAGRGAATRS